MLVLFSIGAKYCSDYSSKRLESLNPLSSKEISILNKHKSVDSLLTSIYIRDLNKYDCDSLQTIVEDYNFNQEDFDKLLNRDNLITHYEFSKKIGNFGFYLYGITSILTGAFLFYDSKKTKKKNEE